MTTKASHFYLWVPKECRDYPICFTQHRGREESPEESWLYLHWYGTGRELLSELETACGEKSTRKQQWVGSRVPDAPCSSWASILRVKAKKTMLDLWKPCLSQKFKLNSQRGEEDYIIRHSEKNNLRKEEKICYLYTTKKYKCYNLKNSGNAN